MSRILRATGALVGMVFLTTQSPTRAQDNKTNVFDLNKKADMAASYAREVGGRPLSEWITDLKNIDPSVRERALRAIPLFGPPASQAVPTIMERCLDRDASPRVRAIGALGMLEISDKDVPKVVETLAKRISDDPQSAIKFQAMKGPDVRCLRAMVIALKDPSMAVRQEAVYGLAVLGRPFDMTVAQTIEKALVTMTDNKDKGISIWAHVGMMNLTKADSTHLKPIMKNLKDKDPQVRLLAVRAMGTLGKLALFGLPELIEALDDKEAEVQYTAIWAIAAMGSSADKAVPPLRAMYQKTALPEPIRMSARAAVEQISGKKEPPLPVTPAPATAPAQVTPPATEKPATNPAAPKPPGS